MTLIVMIDADFSWIIRVYHNCLRHLRSIEFVVYPPPLTTSQKNSRVPIKPLDPHRFI